MTLKKHSNRARRREFNKNHPDPQPRVKKKNNNNSGAIRHESKGKTSAPAGAISKCVISKRKTSDPAFEAMAQSGSEKCAVLNQGL